MDWLSKFESVPEFFSIPHMLLPSVIMHLPVSHLVDDKLEEDTMTVVNSDDDYVDMSGPREVVVGT